MARYLITGGCGFIGSHLTDTLVAEGHEVRILDNFSTGSRENAPEEASLMIGDVRLSVGSPALATKRLGITPDIPLKDELMMTLAAKKKRQAA